MAATPEVLPTLLRLVQEGEEDIQLNLAWVSGQAGPLLKREDLAMLASFWQQHLTSNKSRTYCGEYQTLSSAAYKQLKHLAALHSALVPAPSKKQRRPAKGAKASKKAQ